MKNKIGYQDKGGTYQRNEDLTVYCHFTFNERPASI